MVQDAGTISVCPTVSAFSAVCSAACEQVPSVTVLPGAGVFASAVLMQFCGSVAWLSVAPPVHTFEAEQ